MINTIQDYWYGREPLWKAFWILGTLLPICLTMLLAIILAETNFIYLFKDDTSQKAFVLITYPFFLPFIIFIYVSIWRCANNSKIVWKILARIWLLLAIIRGIFEFISFFTETPLQTGV